MLLICDALSELFMMDTIFERNHDEKCVHVCEMPNEITSHIFRYLDPKSLVNASRVCNYWSHVCQTDPVLRNTVQKQERRRKRFRWCRAKYGDGVLKRENILKGSKEVVLKRRSRMKRLHFLMTLIDIRDMWQQVFESIRNL